MDFYSVKYLKSALVHVIPQFFKIYEISAALHLGEHEENWIDILEGEAFPDPEVVADFEAFIESGKYKEDYENYDLLIVSVSILPEYGSPEAKITALASLLVDDTTDNATAIKHLAMQVDTIFSHFLNKHVDLHAMQGRKLQ